MLVPFTKTDFDKDINGYLATDRYVFRRAESMTILDKDNQEVNYDNASFGDTFHYEQRTNVWTEQGWEQKLLKLDGFFMDNETPFEATLEFIKTQKHTFLFGERGTDNYHTMYASHLGDAMRQTSIVGGVIEGQFKYTRKGSVWCVKMA